MAELRENLVQLLLFPMFFHTDTGAESWSRQLYSWSLDEPSDLLPHRAGIDADAVRPVWWIDLETGTRAIVFDEVDPDGARNVVLSLLMRMSATVVVQQFCNNSCVRTIT